MPEPNKEDKLNIDAVLGLLNKLGKQIRLDEISKASDDISRLEEIENTSDQALIAKWLWKMSIILTVPAFVLVPFIIPSLANILPPAIYEIVWFISKLFMAMVLIMLGLALYLTKADSQ